MVKLSVFISTAISGLRLLLLSINTVWCEEGYGPKGKESVVEVRAVFLKCVPDESHDYVNSETLLFEREEMFKHNTLENCNKKLAITLKMSSEPDSRFMTMDTNNTSLSVEDEYIPIDQVFEGPNKKRLRLLNPYIVRLRREPPRQAYNLQRNDVRGKRELEVEEPDYSLMWNFDDNLDHEPQRSFQQLPKGTPKYAYLNVSDSVLCAFNPNISLPRHKRQTRVKNKTAAKMKSLRMRNQHHRLRSDNENKYSNKRRAMINFNNYEIDDINDVYSAPNEVSDKAYKLLSEISTSSAWTESTNKSNTVSARNWRNKFPVKAIDLKKFKPAKDYALYEIGNPELWHHITLQVFEKISTPEGKILWSDLNNGEVASISYSATDWRNKNMHVRIRSSEWIPRNGFMLPDTRLALLVPLNENNYSSDGDDATPPFDSVLNGSYSQFIVVPLEDVNYVSNKLPRKKRTGIESETDTVTEQAHNRVEVRIYRAIAFDSSDNVKMSTTEQGHFLTLPHRQPLHIQVDLEVKADDNHLVRVGSSGRLATIVADSSRKTRSTIHVQATNTGLAAAKFKVTASQCGPALSREVPIWDPDHLSVGPILLPPHHTQRVRLEVPAEILADSTKCNVALVNEDNEPVAVREVTLKKGDRCFCVWHCDCVCLSDDPKLLCREMSKDQQVAAGLSRAGRPRFERDVQYCKEFTLIRVLGIIVGILLVFIALAKVVVHTEATYLRRYIQTIRRYIQPNAFRECLILCFVKACLGLCFPKIGSCGHHLIMKSPRRLKQYFEEDIRERAVIYDEQGWPVHPDTGKRCVRVLDWNTEFFINTIFFIAAAVILLNEYGRKGLTYACKYICKAKKKNGDVKVFNAHDLKSESRQLIQSNKSHHPPLCRLWMSPEAEKVAGEFFKDTTNIRCNCGPKIYGSDKPCESCDDNCHINQGQGRQKTKKRPQLHDRKLTDRPDCASVADSEQEDTEYVLLQMQKSRESLARNQRERNYSNHSADKDAKRNLELSTTTKK